MLVKQNDEEVQAFANPIWMCDFAWIVDITELLSLPKSQSNENSRTDQ